MGKVILITTTSPHTCRRCKGEIKEGEKAIKTSSMSSSCSESFATTVYLHEKCWQPRRNQNS